LGINVPRIDANPTDFFNALQIENKAMATSGNYQNYYTINGEIVGHTFDPRTGKAVISDLKSVSIIHNRCAVADAYATACMVLGLEKSKKIIAADSSLSAYFIYEENNELKGLFMDATN
jgi:thiamine biosynthesis lipoprotein